MSTDKPKNERAPTWPRIFGVVLVLAGLALLFGGVQLVSLGGSWYYLIAGAATIASGAMLVRGKPQGALLYLVVVFGTVLWSLTEVGTDFWGLVPRLAPVLVLGLIAALSLRCIGSMAKKLALPLAAVQAVVLAAGAVGVFIPQNVIQNTAKLGNEVVTDVPVVTDAASEQNRWTHFGRDGSSTRFAPFNQITAANVDKLEVAWTYRTGAKTGTMYEDQNVPVHVGDSLYLCTPDNLVIAVDAETGREKWKFDAKVPEQKSWNRCRGVAYYEVPAEKRSADGKCDARIVTSTKSGFLYGLDAKTGALCAGFGDQGKVDLSVGLGTYDKFVYMPTSQPLVAGDKVVIGGYVADSQYVGEPSGVIRAFDLNTGELAWAWDVGNPETTKLPPAGQTYSKSTPNYWSSGAFDPKLNLIYLPLGIATPDFWGGHRDAIMNEYSTTVVALNADTGREAWHFQTVHADTWDRDNATPPSLVDLPDGKGNKTPAIVIGTKTHQLFLLNRETGKPIADVEERPVPQEHAAGDVISPTQPWSVGMPQLSKMDLREEDMWGATMFDQLFCRIKYKKMHYAGPYTKMTTDKTMIYFPGFYGGYNWGGFSIDQRTNTLIVNDMHMPQIGKLARQEDGKAELARLQAEDNSFYKWRMNPMAGTPFVAIRGELNSFFGLPCNQPSWGNMTAIDLTTKQIKWQIPTGTTEDTRLGGFRLGLPVPFGLPTLSGAMSTAGGLTFHAGTQDFYIRAFDTNTGKEVWKQRMPVGGQATPISYLSPASGQQFLAVSVGGARLSPERGDYLVAYKLPKQ